MNALPRLRRWLEATSPVRDARPGRIVGSNRMECKGEGVLGYPVRLSVRYRGLGRMADVVGVGQTLNLAGRFARRRPTNLASTTE